MSFLSYFLFFPFSFEGFLSLTFDCRYKFHRESASSQATEGELYTIISNLTDAGYTVLGTVSDMGGGNQGLFNRLGVTGDKPYFEGLNAMDGEILWHLYDAVHVLKVS